MLIKSVIIAAALTTIVLDAVVLGRIWSDPHVSSAVIAVSSFFVAVIVLIRAVRGDPKQARTGTSKEPASDRSS